MSKLDRYMDLATSYLGATKGSAQHKHIVDEYNSLKTLPRGYRLKMKDPWCAAFVSAIARMAGIENVFPCECSCYHMKRIAQSRKWLVDKHEIRRGDLVIYNWDRDSIPDHVGICKQACNGQLAVIEGNMSSKVGIRNINCGNIDIDCGIRIPWDDIGHLDPEPQMIQVAKDVIRGRYGNGSARKKALESAGYDYYEIQTLVNKLLRS